MIDFSLSMTLLLLSGLLAVLVLLLSIEVLAAIFFGQQQLRFHSSVHRSRIGVLVPAHNESTGLRDTLENVKSQLKPGDRLLVVADNCSDDTARIAHDSGAEVTERNDLEKIGKGFALDWGLQHLNADPPDIIIIIDADCRLAEHAVDRLAMVCAETGRPAQALYLITAPATSPVQYRVAEFAFRVKNWVRPLGLLAMNGPCQLTGTGMAFPWNVIRSVDLASEQIVEDLKLGLDLTAAGAPPLFCPSAALTSEFPFSVKGAKSQRQRWEKGHIRIIFDLVPRLLYDSLKAANLALAALALDAAIPPLSFLGMLVVTMIIISAIAVLFGLSSCALLISAASLLVYLTTGLLCWWKFGRDILPRNSVLPIARYAFGKVPLYLQILSRAGETKWIRTDRQKD
jgi:cellulose synthase/poly-beta-1,6-N-acetylglucosamine synthase-like glycosyltransferase